jgi:hypothetical protein
MRKICLRYLRKEFGCRDCHNGGNSNCIDYIEIDIEEAYPDLFKEAH